ncbi:hypothetical protein [Gracilimonas sp. BCB1]|uniref:hypothetical protein n=1 Tax=Gracilimonas sp. BCB1 TaxID=3152362 RepID=UPI0032D8D4E9
MLKKALPYLTPVLLGIALLPIPLLRDFHFESAALVAIIGCFWAAIKAVKPTATQDFRHSLTILGYIFLGGLPLFITALFTSCLTFDGFGFWIFIPLPSVFLGTAIGRLIRSFYLPFAKTLTLGVLLFISLGVWVIEFLSFPQVYFYNHVWGVWPGPIYDEAVQLTGAFLYFRWITFLWIILLWVLPNWSRNLQTKLVTGFTLISLLFSYLNLDEAGIISPQESIQAQLGGEHQTTHFTIHFEQGFYSPEEIEYWAAKHEFYFQQINDRLNIEWPEDRRVESYFYAHAWQKKKITGAKFTSYVPIWLAQDQLHIAKQQLEDVLKHELVHVLSKQFGNALFNGSRSIGLIEGLAEGIAKGASPRSTLHQIVAGEQPYPSTEDMQSALSFSGFYSSSGAVSYTTAGSFVEYLLSNYSVDSFKDAYATADIESAYDTSFSALVDGWHQALAATPLDSIDRQVSEFIFAQRSLFEKDCPHSISTEMRLWDEYRFLLADRDTLAAYQSLDELYKLFPKNDLVKDARVRSELMQGNYEDASVIITPNDSLLALQVLKADALFLAGQIQKADSVLEYISPKIKQSEARNFRYTLTLRIDSVQWKNHVQRRYQNVFPDGATFASLNLPNKMLSLNKALTENRDSLAILYAHQLLEHNPNPHWFDIYDTAIDRLSFMGEFDLADRWIALIDKESFRLRYRERLEEQKEWQLFLRTESAVAD